MANYKINSPEEYKRVYNESVKQPETFWNDLAKDNFRWQKHWDSVLNWDFQKPEIKWFEGGKLNITENCLDRHLKDKPQKTAIIFEPNNPKESSEHISYEALYHRVNRMANVLKAQGVKKGDRVCIYLPMIPELAISVLACARIGAVHSVVFAGFSSNALSTRINDCDCKIVLTSDGSFRGNKVLDLKKIVDEALEDCPQVSSVLVVERTKTKIYLEKGRDHLIKPLLQKASSECLIEIMDSEDPLFILYTSGSTGKPKGMVHSSAGYMVGAAYTFKNIFQYNDGDVYWCTADIGWITGHSYIVYGPLLNGATTLMFEGVPSHPDYGRFWEIVEKHKVNQFYTAPTAIRALAKESLDFVKKHDLSSLKVLGSVGEPINEEAWNWYSNNIGKNKCPIVDTWWQTETGSIMISSIPNITESKPTYATLPFIGIQPVLMDENGNEILENEIEGRLCLKYPWPSIARTIWGDHDRYKNTYFSSFDNKYFTGDGSYRDNNGLYRITGRVDDVIIVSGHNLGTAPIEDAINEHDLVAESAIIGVPHDIKGNSLFGYVTLKDSLNSSLDQKLKKEINHLISKQIGPIAKLDRIEFVSGLPKTRSGKIMRRILRKIAHDDIDNLGDITTLLNPEIVDEIIAKVLS
ncbi:MAG: acetate--CoA ligase [Flavobacteriaceae bacterium]|nr:acetate--CoA ligase [Flavobacteriaceae bacterium]